MKLDDLTFWVSSLSGDLFVGTKSKRDPHLANQKREITGLMINGIVEWMRQNERVSVCVEQAGKRYCISLTEHQMGDFFEAQDAQRENAK